MNAADSNTTDWEAWLADFTGLSREDVAAMSDDDFEMSLEEHTKIAADECRLSLAQLLDRGLDHPSDITGAVAQRLEAAGLDVDRSGRSEAIYVRRDDGPIVRLAAHEGGAPSSWGNEQPKHDLRLGGSIDGTTTELVECWVIEDVAELAAKIEGLV